MKMLVVLAFVAAASAVPLLENQPQPFQLPEAPQPYVESVQIIEKSPVFQDVPSDNSVNFVDSPLEDASQIRFVERAEPAQPDFYIPFDINPEMVPADLMVRVADTETNDILEKQAQIDTDNINYQPINEGVFQVQVKEAGARLPFVYLGDDGHMAGEPAVEHSVEAVRIIDSPLEALNIQPIKLPEPALPFVEVNSLPLRVPIQARDLPVYQDIAPLELESIRVVDTPVEVQHVTKESPVVVEMTV